MNSLCVGHRRGLVGQCAFRFSVSFVDAVRGLRVAVAAEEDTPDEENLQGLVSLRCQRERGASRRYVLCTHLTGRIACEFLHRSCGTDA